MSKQYILIVDNNEAFATILKEGIESGTEYDAMIVTTASEARNVASRGNLAMAIVDMGLEDDDPVELLRTLRQRHADLRLMCIPAGEMPDEVHSLGIQGILPKPFFLPEIPAQIEQAMSRSVQPIDAEELAAGPAEAEIESDASAQLDLDDVDSFWEITSEDTETFSEIDAAEFEPPPPQIEQIIARSTQPEPEPIPTPSRVAEPQRAATTPPTPEPWPRAVEAATPAPEPATPSAAAGPSSRLLDHLAAEARRLTHHLNSLSRELSAEAVLLTCGPNLVAHTSHLGHVEAESLARVISESWEASVRVANALGHKNVRFEQSLHEGEDYLLYSLAATSDVVLSVALRADRPLGMIRYNVRRTVEAIQPFLLPR